MRSIIGAFAAGLMLSAWLVPLPLAGQETVDTGQLADVVAARQALMTQIDTLMADLELILEEPGETDAARASALAALLAPALRAFPHLFPEASSPENLTTAGVTAATSAAPAIWEDFERFYALAHQSAERADAIGAARDIAEIGTLTEQLRESCTSCHETFLFYDPFAAMGLGTLPPGAE